MVVRRFEWFTSEMGGTGEKARRGQTNLHLASLIPPVSPVSRSYEGVSVVRQADSKMRGTREPIPQRTS
jgi:hypothetical protein